MSSVYVLEPPTKGKVVVYTTHGPIDIELWPKETPKSVRNFVQLCLEGYFDNTIFHRVIPGFLVQGGDPTGSGTGGDSIYGGVFADEFHSRLRFSHRGIVAMANASTPNSNGSQFFFTLDKCDWLDKKHTVFGKVTGDSIFNLLRLGEVDTGKDDRPLDPAPKILSVEVLWNPFEDIVPRVLAKHEPVAEIKESPKKPVKKLNLLSFGEEAEEEEKELALVKQKIKSSHDVLDDPRLLKAEATNKERNASESKEVLSVREALGSKKEAAQKKKSFSVSDSVGHSDDDDDDDDDEDEEELEPRVLKKSKNDSVVPCKGEGSSETLKQKTNMKKLSSTQRDIPFVIHAPTSFEELTALVEDCSNEDIILIVSRIRITDSIKLAAGNRRKMQVFYGILLQYFAVLAHKKPLNFELLNMLVKPLIEMSKEIPYFAAICARQRLLKTRAQFCEAIKNPEDGCWPSLKTLFLLRLWSMIFPCSDYRHTVMTPLILLMCEYLMRCPISSGRDIAIGSFLCSIVLLVAKQSKKFCPEAILFIRTLLMAASDKKSPASEESEFYHFMELKSLTPLLCIKDHVKEVVPLNFIKIMDQPADSPYFSSDDFRASILSSVVETLRGFVEINGGLSSFPEIFMPISTLLHQVGNQENIPQFLKEKLVDVAKLIEQKTDEHHEGRKPLSMRKQKPVGIRMVNPKFEENFVKGRDYDPDKLRSEHKKLKKKLKEEARRAEGELRKDSYFMSNVKSKEKAVKEQERAEKHGKAWAFLQEQEHAFKSGQLGKGKGKKRRR